MTLTTALQQHLPMFLRFAAREDSIAEARMADLNRLAHTKGWRAALQQVFPERLSGTQHTSFIETLPLTSTSDVLEIGAGFGHVTEALARRVRSVAALEVVASRAQFTAERCRQEGLANVWMAIGGDDCRLPYGPATFDVVVLNLSVERCAARCAEGSQLEAQRRLLDEIRCVLRPGGTLRLATESRYAMSA